MPETDDEREKPTMDIKEQQEKAEIILRTAINRVREMGFGIVADGTTYGNGVWMQSLRVEYRGRALPPI